MDKNYPYHTQTYRNTEDMAYDHFKKHFSNQASGSPNIVSFPRRGNKRDRRHRGLVIVKHVNSQRPVKSQEVTRISIPDTNTKAAEMRAQSELVNDISTGQATTADQMIRGSQKRKRSVKNSKNIAKRQRQIVKDIFSDKRKKPKITKTK